MFRGLSVLFFLAVLSAHTFASGGDEAMLEDKAVSKSKPSLLQNLRYEVYAGGFHAVEANMTVDLSEKGRYSVLFGAETRGVLENFVPWKGTFESKGWILNDGTNRPEIHESVAMWKDEREVKSYHYQKDGGFKDITVSYVGKKPKTRKPDEALTKGTTDVLSATLMMMEHVANGGECNGSSEVFDGKRRYEMIFNHVRHVMMEETRYNVYSGPAIECTVEVKPVAGEWHKKPRGWLSIQEQGRERGMMPTVWFAKIGGNEVAVPVRVRVKTAYGAMFMHLTSYKGGDIVLTANN